MILDTVSLLSKQTGMALGLSLLQTSPQFASRLQSKLIVHQLEFLSNHVARFRVFLFIMISIEFFKSRGSMASDRTVEPPPGVLLLEELPPFSVEYEDTTDYHWKLISEEDTNHVISTTEEAGSASITMGPWGFNEAMELEKTECLVKSAFNHPNDQCIMHPKNCHQGLSFSIWEKVYYREDVLNIFKEHSKQYIFSTGGDFDYIKEKSYPGVAIYHQGMDLIAVVSTGEDVWYLQVTGQLMNQTWSNIGVRWEPNNDDPSLPINDRGGLELYVNAKKVGHAIQPLERPRKTSPTDEGYWVQEGPLVPDPNDPTWGLSETKPPIILVGCHRNNDDTDFKHFAKESTSFDELSIWTRKLQVNRTHEETLYFIAGYQPMFENMPIEEWYEMMDSVDLDNPGQAEAAAYVIQKYSNSFMNGTYAFSRFLNDSSNSTDLFLKQKSDYIRTVEQKIFYERQIIENGVRAKLLSTAALRDLERPKYLARKLNVLPVAAQVLEGTEENQAGCLSIQMDPDEEGCSLIPKIMENYALTFMSSADIAHDEDYPPLYSTDLSDFTIHSSSPAYQMSITKVYPENLAKNGGRIRLKDYYNDHPVNPTPSWVLYDEDIEIPSYFPFKNDSVCLDKPMTIMTSIYNSYGEMAPLRRNPATIRAKDIKIDSKVISVKMAVSPDPKDPDDFTNDYSICHVDSNKMKYSPIVMTFYHLDPQTARRKLLWHDDDLRTSIDVRRCAVFNEDLGVDGGWDATGCTTVLSEQDATVCECSVFGTFTVIAEKVEQPHLDDEYDWLTIVKYIGYTLSIILLLIFILIILMTPPIWDMFHLLRLHSGIFCFLGLVSMFAAEWDTVRDDRHTNICFSILQHYFFLTTGVFLFSESFACFRAITSGIIGGKTWSYITLSLGLPMLNLGLALYFYGEDYGTDPRAFLGWNNETKWVFFYGMLPATIIAVLLCFVILFNTATAKTRKDSVIEHLATQGQGLAIFVFIFALTWFFGIPAFMRYPDHETADFYPIFAILNSLSGLFIFCFLGLTSVKFRTSMFGQARKRRQQLMAAQFGAFHKEEEEEGFDTVEDLGNGQGKDEDEQARPASAQSKSTVITENSADNELGLEDVTDHEGEQLQNHDD